MLHNQKRLTENNKLLKRWEKAYKETPFSLTAYQKEDAAWNELCQVRRQAYYAKLEELSKRGVRKKKEK